MDCTERERAREMRNTYASSTICPTHLVGSQQLAKLAAFIKTLHSFGILRMEAEVTLDYLHTYVGISEILTPIS